MRHLQAPGVDETGEAAQARAAWHEDGQSGPQVSETAIWVPTRQRDDDGGAEAPQDWRRRGQPKWLFAVIAIVVVIVGI